jgi:hypothetical protein
MVVQGASFESPGLYRSFHRESVNQLLPYKRSVLLEKLVFLSMGPSSAFG